MANTTISTMLATTAMLTLAACGGGSSEIANNPTVSTPIQSQFSSEAKVTAGQNALSVMRLNWGNRTTTIIPKNDFSIQKSPSGLLSVVYEGKTYEFSSEQANINEDGNVSGYVYDGVDSNNNPFYVQIFGLSEPLTEIYDEASTDYAFLVDYMVLVTESEDQFAGDFGFAVLGTPSNQTALGNFSTEAFNGRLNAEVLPADFSNAIRGGRADRHVLSGNVTLTANIAENTVTGTVTDIGTELFYQHVSQGRVNQTGSITLDNGVIVNNSFSGDVVMDQTIMESLNLSALDATFKGAFYGPNIEQAAGVLSGTGTRQNSDVNMIGGFSGNRD